jgi:hypothetical protein
LAKIPILGGQVKASGNNSSALNAGADIKVFPVFKGGFAGGAIGYFLGWNLVSFFPDGIKVFGYRFGHLVVRIF